MQVKSRHGKPAALDDGECKESYAQGEDDDKRKGKGPKGDAAKLKAIDESKEDAATINVSPLTSLTSSPPLAMVPSDPASPRATTSHETRLSPAPLSLIPTPVGTGSGSNGGFGSESGGVSSLRMRDMLLSKVKAGQLERLGGVEAEGGVVRLLRPPSRMTKRWGGGNTGTGGGSNPGIGEGRVKMKPTTHGDDGGGIRAGSALKASPPIEDGRGGQSGGILNASTSVYGRGGVGECQPQTETGGEEGVEDAVKSPSPNNGGKETYSTPNSSPRAHEQGGGAGRVVRVSPLLAEKWSDPGAQGGLLKATSAVVRPAARITPRRDSESPGLKKLSEEMTL